MGLSIFSKPQAVPPLGAACEYVAPATLDELIQGEASRPWEFESFRWYQGPDASGVLRTFRFKRGDSLSDWHELLRRQSLTAVEGPFRTQSQATAIRESFG
jgi:hypothetical protein